MAALGFSVAAGSNGDDDLADAIRTSCAELALLDVGVAGIQAERTLDALRQHRPQVRVVLGCAPAPEAVEVYRALARGAAGFLALDAPLDELQAGLGRIARGDTVVSTSIERLLVEQIRVGTDQAKMAILSPRQLSILQLVADGASTRQIAESLGISPLTVKTHYRGIYEKLGACNKGVAIAEGFRRGLLT